MKSKPTYENLEQKIETLNTALRRYRDLYERSPLPYHSLNKDGCFVDVNPAWLELLGYEKSEVLGKNYGDFLHPDWKPVFANKFPQFLRLGEVHEVYFKIRHKNGQYIDISLDGCINTDDAGAFLNTNCVFTDITEQVKSQEALKKSEEWHRTVLETAKSGILTIDLTGKISSTNKAYCQISGYSKQELVGMSLADLEANESKEEIKEHIAKIMQEGSDLFETKHRRKDGQIIDVEVNTAFINLENGRFVAFFTDITEKKKLQAQAIRSSQLITLGELAAGVAHEINNPIGGVINYAEILLNKVEDQDHKLMLNRIIYEGERVADIVSKLLSFARDERQKFSLNKVETLIEDSFALFKRALEKDGIRFEIDCEEGLPLLPCKGPQIEQVILNLLSNSKHALNEKFGHAETVKKIMVSSKQISKGKERWLELIFEDNGCGIPEELLTQVSTPFFTTKGAGAGTGLGLSIIEEIVKSHNGYIRYESQPGEFTRIILELPYTAKG